MRYRVWHGKDKFILIPRKGQGVKYQSESETMLEVSHVFSLNLWWMLHHMTHSFLWDYFSKNLWTQPPSPSTNGLFDPEHASGLHSGAFPVCGFSCHRCVRVLHCGVAHARLQGGHRRTHICRLQCAKAQQWLGYVRLASTRVTNFSRLGSFFRR